MDYRLFLSLTMLTYLLVPRILARLTGEPFEEVFTRQMRITGRVALVMVVIAAIAWFSR